MNSTFRKLHNSICVLYEVLKWPLCTCLLGCDRMLVLSSYFFHSPALIKKHFNRNTDNLQVLPEFCEKERESNPDWCFLLTPASPTTSFSDSYLSRNFQLIVSVLEPNKSQTYLILFLSAALEESLSFPVSCRNMQCGDLIL